MPKSFRRTLGRHCYCALSENSEFQRNSVTFFVRVLSPINSAPWRVAHGLSSLARAPHASLDGHRCRWRRASPELAASAVAKPPVAANRRQRQLATPFGAAQRSPALRVASCTPAHPAAPSPWPGRHRARPLPPTGPRRPVPSNPPRAPNPSSFSAKTEPVDLHVVAQPPKLPDQPLHRRNHCRTYPVHGNRLGPAIYIAPPSSLSPPHTSTTTLDRA